MTSSRTSVDAAVASVETAIATKDVRLLESAHQDLVGVPRTVLAEHSARIGPRLAALLPKMPMWHSAVYAVLVGALVEWNADATACAPEVLAGLRRNLLRGLDFVRLWRERFGDEEDLPDPGGFPTPEEQKRFGSDYDEVWYTPHFGWLTVQRWERAAVAVLADPRVRRSLADRDELVRLTERLEPEFGDLQCVQRALLLLDDEPLLVLDRPSGKAFRMRMSGISGNYQLQTLLAGVLIGGGHLPGQAPSPEAIAISTDAPIDMADLDALPSAAECFNFSEPSGRWIWSETTPSRIPVVDGVRRLVLDPPVYRHHYRAVRFLPRVPARLELEAVLSPDEAAPYFAGVQPLMSHQEAGRLAADGY